MFFKRTKPSRTSKCQTTHSSKCTIFKAIRVRVRVRVRKCTIFKAQLTPYLEISWELLESIRS